MPYIYENVDGAVLVQKYGPEQKTNTDDQTQELKQQLQEAEFWSKIRIAAKGNPSISDALNRACMLYELSKDHEN